MESKLNDEPLLEAKTRKKIPKNLLIAFLLCLTISVAVAVSSGITFLLIQSAQQDQAVNKDSKQDALLMSFQESIKEQDKKLTAMQGQNDVMQLYLRHSSATALKNILINQEQNIQAYLKAMQSAMSDLSGLIPSATDWNIRYQYQLDLAQKSSIEREDLLSLLKTGEPNDTVSTEQ